MESVVMLAIAGMVLYFWRKDKAAAGSSNTTTNTTTQQNIPSTNPYARSDGAVSASRDASAGVVGSTGSVSSTRGTSGNPDADIHGISQSYVNPNAANIVTTQATGPVVQTTPAGQSYVVQPITVPVGQSPYYWTEAVWLKLFAENRFTNPEVARAIYAKRDPSNPEYE